MYLRCAGESKPVWNGNRRVLLQNNSNHNPAKAITRISSTRCAGNFLIKVSQVAVTTHPITTKMSQNCQFFSSASNVPVPPVTGFPQQGIFAADASAA